MPIFTLLRKDDTIKIEKLPSGSYRVRKMYKGQTYAIIFDYKATQKEVMQALAKELDNVKGGTKTKLDFSDAVEQYISIKSNVLSLTSIPDITAY